jgi:hypothetical protein
LSLAGWFSTWLFVYTGYQLVTSCTNWNLKIFDHYQCWLVLGCVHHYQLVSFCVLFTGNSTVRSGASWWDQTGQDRTGQDWTHNPHPPWLGLSNVTSCEQGVPEVRAPHV